MDSFGSLEMAWCQGYEGCRATYITQSVICFKCGNSIKFYGEDGHESVFPSPAEGLGPVAVHSINKQFALATVGLHPKIHVYQYPSFREISELEGGAQLEYTELVFSSSDYLASISGVPEFQLTIWQYKTGVKLCSHDISQQMPVSITFNPANWRQLFLTTNSEISLWDIQQSHETYLIKQDKVKLPPALLEAGQDDHNARDIPTRSSTRMSRATVDLPRSSVAGVKGQRADRFEEYEDDTVRVVPVSHCWTPSGDILVGCAGGQLFKLDIESHRVSMLINPHLQYVQSMGRLDSAISEHSISEGISSTSFNKGMTDGSMRCLALHKNGLYAAGEDGVLRRFDTSQGQVKLVSSQNVGTPISSLAFNHTYEHLAIGSSRGCLQVYNPSEPANIQQLFDIHHGNFVAVDTLIPGTEHIVTLREDGELQVWRVDTAKLVSSLPIGFQTFSMASCPLSHAVAVGSASGYVFIIDLNNLDNPRIVHRMHLHQGPVKHLVYNSTGNLLLTASNDGHIFVVDGRPSKNFSPLGYVDMPGDIEGIALLHEREGFTKVLVTSNASGKKELAATKLIHFSIPDKIAQDVKSKHASLKCDFRQDVINKLAFNFGTPSFGAALADGNVAFVISQNSKQLHKILLPDQPPKKENSKDSYLHPVGEFEGHELAGGRLLMSPHGRWLASVGRDGILSVRALGTLDRAVRVNAHDFHKGGVQDVAFSSDAHQMFTAGLDGTLTCYKWNFTASGQTKAKSALESARMLQMELVKGQQEEDAALEAMSEWVASEKIHSRPASATEKAEKEQSEKEHDIEKAIESDKIYSTPTPTPGSDATWLEARQLEALQEEDKQFADVKLQLRSEIRDMRRKLQGMMSENQTYPDIERLEQYEFDLDMEEQLRLQAEGDADVQRIREEKEFENLAKMYLTELIKKECWDEMEVKGRGILAFGSTLEVSNYAMRSRSREELDKLQRVKVQRQIEQADLAARREIAEIRSKGPADEEMHEADDVEDEGKEKPSTTGSLGVAYGGGSDLFYSQFELHTREQKIMQVTLLEDAIIRIKQTFNKEFDEVYKKKEQEIAKILEKNKRIRKILDDLGLPLDVYEPVMGAVEKPEMLLTVRDDEADDEEPDEPLNESTLLQFDQVVVLWTNKKESEEAESDGNKQNASETDSEGGDDDVKVEKYLTPEQRKRLEQEEKEEEERRLRERGDNWRERGLDMMMGGVLEIKKEDELKKDIPVPAFMVNKQEAEWSEEEKRAATEYERKVKELNEERDKYHKQLEMELKKLQTQIQEGTQLFDEALQQLFLKKVKTEMVIYQEELKILRIRHSLLSEEELNNREEELNDLLEFKKDMKNLSAEALNIARKNVDAFRNDYDILVAEDKVMDRAFRREFNDVPAVYVEQLYKLFRRRPRGQKARAAETPTFDSASGNPFAERPSTARLNQLSMNTLEQSLAELDKEVNKPEGLDSTVWDHLCQYRRQKVESENLVKQKALVLADMQAFLQERSDEDDKVKNDIEELEDQLNRLKDDRLRFTCNLEIQLLLKQGQVEVETPVFILDYRHSILTHRSVVEDLNTKIRQLGESKIASMVESKDFRKGIIQLEWEHKKMTMEMEDLHNKMRDIQNLKVSREIQAFLNEEDYDSKKSQEIQTLEQTIQLQKEHHEKSVHEKKRTLRDLKSSAKEKEMENEALSQELEELNVSVNERRHIHEVNADKRSDAGMEERYREIVQRRKLVDLAKAQAQEVAILRAEVERLRMRTFPALVQVEH